MMSFTIRLDIQMIFLETVQKVKVDSYPSLTQEKTLSLDNVLISLRQYAINIEITAAIICS